MFTIKNTETFKKAFEQISYFIDEANIHTNENGLTIKAFDNAQMLYLEYNLPKTEIFGDLESNVFGINIVEFNKILNKISNSEKLSFFLSMNQLALEVKGSYERTYFFPLKDIDEKELKTNEEDYEIEINIKGSVLKDVFTSSKTISDAIVFECKDKEIKLYSSGIYGKYTTKIIPKKTINCKTKYSANYLYNMVRNVDSDTDVEIKMNLQQPLYLTYLFGKNKIKYFLAHMFV